MIEELDNSALLVIYLADELSVQDRREVDRRLAAEPALALELESLRAAQSGFYETMLRADRVFPIAGEASAVPRIGRAMRSHQLLRPAKQSLAKSPRLWNRLPGWAYPLTAAAAVALVFIGWWAQKPVSPTLVSSKPVFTRMSEEPSEASDAVESVEAPVNLVEDTTESSLEQNFRNSNSVQNLSIGELSLLESRVADLSYISANPIANILSDHPLFPEDE